MKNANQDLGRVEGVFVPAVDVLAHESAGWTIVIDALDAPGGDGRILMLPPDNWGEGRGGQCKLS